MVRVKERGDRKGRKHGCVQVEKDARDVDADGDADADADANADAKVEEASI